MSGTRACNGPGISLFRVPLFGGAPPGPIPLLHLSVTLIILQNPTPGDCCRKPRVEPEGGGGGSAPEKKRARDTVNGVRTLGRQLLLLKQRQREKEEGESHGVQRAEVEKRGREPDGERWRKRPSEGKGRAAGQRGTCQRQVRGSTR